MAEALALYGYKVVFIEYDRSVLERTRRRLIEAGIDNILFVNGDAHKMSFLDNTLLNQRGKERVAKMHLEKGRQHEAKIDIVDISDYLMNNYDVESQIIKGDYIDILTA